MAHLAPSIAAEPPRASLEIEALEVFVVERPWLAYALEAELNRLWGGRPVFETSPSQPDPPFSKTVV